MIDRLKKKCFVGSVLVHGLLCGVVLFGAAFGGKEPQPQSIELVSLTGIVTDGPSRGGDPAPASQPAAQPAPEPPPAPEPTPVKPEPVSKPVKPVVVPKPPPEPKPEPQPIDKSTLDPVSDRGEIAVKPVKKPTVKKLHKVDVDLSKTVDLDKVRNEAKAAEVAQEKKAAAAAAEARRERFASMHNAVSGERKGLTSAIESSGASGVVVDVPGQGGGGLAFANYTQYVYSAYYAAWVPPDSVVGHPSVFAIIVVARDGSIISAEISKSSSDSAYNRSVERALRKVTNLHAFPSETRDLQRKFRIEFTNPESKESIG